MTVKKLMLCSSMLFACHAFAGTMGAVEETKKLYLRADLGGNFFQTPSATTASELNASQQSPWTSISNVVGYNVGLGYQLTPKFRGDVTFTYRPNIGLKAKDNVPEIGHGQVKNYTVMGNLYLDLDYFKSPLMPYIMGGLGVSSLNGNDTMYWPVVVQHEYGQTQTHFAWQLGAGLSYAIGSNWALDFSYQYIGLGSLSYTGQYDKVPSAGCNNASCMTTSGAPTHFDNIYDNQIQLGVRYYFK